MSKVVIVDEIIVIPAQFQYFQEISSISKTNSVDVEVGRGCAPSLNGSLGITDTKDVCDSA